MGDFEQTIRDFEAGLAALGAPALREYETNGKSGTGAELYDEIPEMEMASQLLDTHGEAEMEQFFGDILKAVGGVLRSPVGQALTGALKTVAKAALPTVGAAIGNAIAPGVGGALGSRLGSGAGQLLGLEMEGMSPQDREFETARRLVRLATVAGREAAQIAPGVPPAKAAAAALHAAAQKVAPGLVRNVSQVVMGPGTQLYGADRETLRELASSGGTGYAGQGRWVRQGGRIVLFGA